VKKINFLGRLSVVIVIFLMTIITPFSRINTVLAAGFVEFYIKIETEDGSSGPDSYSVSSYLCPDSLPDNIVNDCSRQISKDSFRAAGDVLSLNKDAVWTSPPSYIFFVVSGINNGKIYSNVSNSFQQLSSRTDIRTSNSLLNSSNYNQKTIKTKISGNAPTQTSTTSPVSPPPPDSKWVRAWNNDDNEYNLKLQSPTNTSSYPWVFNKYKGSAPLYDAWGATHVDNILSQNAEVWRVIGKTPLLFAIVDETRMPDKVIAFCARGEPNPQPVLKKLRTFYSAERRAIFFVNVDEDIFSCLLKRNSSDVTNSEDWISHHMNSFTSDEDSKLLVNTAWSTIKNDQNSVFDKGRTGTAPGTENIDTCKSNGVKPMMYGNPDARTQFDQAIEKMKEDVIAKTDNDIVIEHYRDYFENEAKINALFDDLNSNDYDLYRKFYGDPSKDYPTVPPSDGLYNDYLELYQQIQNQVPLEDRPDSMVDMIIRDTAGVAVGGIAATSGVGLLWSGTIAVGTAAAVGRMSDGVDNYITGGAFAATFPNLLKLQFATIYLLANEKYNECLANNGDPYGMPNADLANLVKNLANDANDIGSGVNQGSGNKYCDIKGLGSYTTWNLIFEAFCTMVVAFKTGVDGLFDYAIDFMSNMIGITDSRSTSSSTGSSSSSSSSSEVTDDLKTKAKNLCTTKKDSTEDSVWLNGPCLGDIEGSDYQLDIVTMDESEAVNTNFKCEDAEKYLKYDTDCNFKASATTSPS